MNKKKKNVREGKIPITKEPVRSADTEFTKELTVFPQHNSMPIDEMFSQEMGMKNPSDVVKELFSVQDIKTKTDLSEKQVSKIARVFYLADFLDMPELKTLMTEFITLRVSKDRKSREEFVNAFKSDRDSKQGFMSGLMGSVGDVFHKGK